MKNLWGWLLWQIGGYGVAHGYIGRSKFFDYCLSRGGAWAFNR